MALRVLTPSPGCGRSNSITHCICWVAGRAARKDSRVKTGGNVTGSGNQNCFCLIIDPEAFGRLKGNAEARMGKGPAPYISLICCITIEQPVDTFEISVPFPVPDAGGSKKAGVSASEIYAFWRRRMAGSNVLLATKA